jgi:lysine 2,3-aminomutase
MHGTENGQKISHFQELGRKHRRRVPAPISLEPAAHLNGAAYPRPGLAPVSWRQHYFPDVMDADWNDWRWQFRNRIRSLDALDAFLPLSAAARGALKVVLREFRLGITPYYLSLIDPADPADPLRLQSVPSIEEAIYGDLGTADPLSEDEFSPVPGITHRYPDRCLLVATNSCALYCRYCTRKRIMEEGDAPLPKGAFDAMFAYIAKTPRIRDVIVSGGDPLTWSASRLQELLQRLREIPHVEIIRFGSRVPVTLPQRIDRELCAMLERHGPIWINVHFNHPREVTREAALACDRLLRCGIPLNNQAVLLRGINDDPAVIKALVHALMRIKVRPYYLYHCDPVRGAHHFRTTIAKGIEIIEALRGHTSGLAVPTYVIDAPGGGGKVPIQPTYLQSYKGGRAVFRNFQGRVFEYDDPEITSPLDGNRSSKRASTPAPNKQTLAQIDERLVGYVGRNGHGKPAVSRSKRRSQTAAD